MNKYFASAGTDINISMLNLLRLFDFTSFMGILIFMISAYLVRTSIVAWILTYWTSRPSCKRIQSNKI